METRDILIQKNLGTFAPSTYLSNLAMVYYGEPTYAHRRIFPSVPVALPSGKYFEFEKADLARINTQIKPPYGSVAPAIFGLSEKSYSCKVYQILIGLDEIMARPYEVLDSAVDPRRVRVKTIIEQISLKQEVEFAQNFFKSGVWSNEWQGAANDNVAQKKFKKFSQSVDPLKFIDDRATEIRRAGRRRPNKLALGLDVFNALKNNPFVLEKIKYSGNAQNPAVVTENVLAQIFGVERVVVLDATYNAAGFGQVEDMQFICSPKDALLLYAPDQPSIEDASAGMIFSWTINSNNTIAIQEFDGPGGTHVQLMEGLIAFDMKKTADSLAVFMKDCVE